MDPLTPQKRSESPFCFAKIHSLSDRLSPYVWCDRYNPKNIREFLKNPLPNRLFSSCEVLELGGIFFDLPHLTIE